jgi:hypothetical protein
MTAGLRRFLAPRAPEPERCELCGAALPAHGHRHLVDTEHRSLACACTPCGLLFEHADGRYRAVPDRCLMDRRLELDWERLQIPVGVAFFFHNSELDRLVALYPSPAGATESELDTDAWQAVLDGTRLAGLLEPDVEALLLRRTRDGVSCYLVPIDLCYQLVGRMRLHWKGFDGGAEAQRELAEFFDRVAARAKAPEEVA